MRHFVIGGRNLNKLQIILPKKKKQFCDRQNGLVSMSSFEQDYLLVTCKCFAIIMEKQNRFHVNV